MGQYIWGREGRGDGSVHVLICGHVHTCLCICEMICTDQLCNVSPHVVQMYMYRKH